MKRLIVSLVLVVAFVMSVAVSGCTGACTDEDRDSCRAQHSDCVNSCDPLSAGYTQCVDTCDIDLDSCLDDHGCS